MGDVRGEGWRGVFSRWPSRLMNQTNLAGASRGAGADWVWCSVYFVCANSQVCCAEGLLRYVVADVVVVVHIFSRIWWWGFPRVIPFHPVYHFDSFFRPWPDPCSLDRLELAPFKRRLLDLSLCPIRGRARPRKAAASTPAHPSASLLFTVCTCFRSAPLAHLPPLWEPEPALLLPRLHELSLPANVMTREPPVVPEQPRYDVDDDVYAALWAAASPATLPNDTPAVLRDLTITVDDPKRVYVIHNASRRHGFQTLVERSLFFLACPPFPC